MTNILFPHNLAVGAQASTAIINLEVTFNSIPNSPTVTTANVKHNKEAVLLYQKDDATADDLTVLKPVFQTLYGTDGAGKKRNYRASIALNAGGHDVVHPQILDYDELTSIIDDNHSISNHGYSHGGVDIYNELKAAEIRMWDQFKLRGKQVRTRTTIIPTADEGYVSTSFYLDYVFVTSGFGVENTKDGYTINYGNQNIINLPKQQMILSRDYFGNDFSEIEGHKTYFDTLMLNSTLASPLVRSVFSHDISNPTSLARYNEFWSYVMNHPLNNDRLLVESMQDFYEYYETINNSVINSNLVGNKLTITINQSAISGNNFRRDMSLLISGGSIKNIQVTNVDSSSFNGNTGLINLYKTNKKVNDPNLDLVPPKITNVVRNGLTLTVNFNKSVTGNTGFEIIGNVISSITGSGNSRVLTCTASVLTGNIFYYRMQNGNIADTSNAVVKLCSYIKYIIT